jgi:hypothetical protein
MTFSVLSIKLFLFMSFFNSVSFSYLYKVSPTLSRTFNSRCNGVRVSISAPPSVTSIVCSNCAESEPSLVRTVQPSLRSVTTA